MAWCLNHGTVCTQCLSFLCHLPYGFSNQSLLDWCNASWIEERKRNSGNWLPYGLLGKLNIKCLLFLKYMPMKNRCTLNFKCGLNHAIPWSSSVLEVIISLYIISTQVIITLRYCSDRNRLTVIIYPLISWTVCWHWLQWTLQPCAAAAALRSAAVQYLALLFLPKLLPERRWETLCCLKICYICYNDH